MERIKYRQALWDYNSDKFFGWHYWGFIGKEFISPVTSGVDPNKNYQSYQFCGILDKNGKEIYEGDIIKVWDRNRSVNCKKYEDDVKHDISKCQECNDEMFICTQEVKFNCGWFTYEEIGDFCQCLSEDFLELEVIGNIYEDPSLLNQ